MTGRTSATTGAGAAGGGDARRPAGDGTGAGPGRRRAATFRGGLAKAPRRGVLCAREEDYNKLYTVPPIVPPTAMQAGRRALAKHRPAGSTAQQAAQTRPAGPAQAGTDQGGHQPSRPASRPPSPGQQSQPAENQTHTHARDSKRARERANYTARGRAGPPAGLLLSAGSGAQNIFRCDPVFSLPPEGPKK